MLVETTPVTKFEYYFPYTHKGIHLCDICSFRDVNVAITVSFRLTSF